MPCRAGFPDRGIVTDSGIVNNRISSLSGMTENARRLNSSAEEDGKVVYIEGITFTAVKVSDRKYWVQSPSRYVCLVYDGKAYVKRK